MVYLYKKTKPTTDEIVLAKITEINELNVVGVLPDYNNLQGYISFSELSRRRKVNVNKIVQIGKEIIVQITGFNDEKNYAELSVRTITPADIEEFNKMHKPRISLYNLWRYVYMKLNPDIGMDINKINYDNLNLFMNKTFWKIEEILEEKTEEYNFMDLHKLLLNKSKNEKIINLIEDYDTVLIKNILDSYSDIKIIPTKQCKTQEFNLMSFDIDGLDKIKTILDYKSFDKYLEISKKYDITILYLSAGKYSMNIKEKNPSTDDIISIYDYMMDEIKNRCEKYNAIITNE